jgi:hypothetical protein
MNMSMTQFDAIVIGGSYAWLSAALQLARARPRVLVVDAGQRRNRFASESHGFLPCDGQMAAAIAWACRMEVAAMQKRGVLAIDDTPVLRIEDSATVVLADGRRIPHAGLFTYGRLHMASPIALLLGCEFDEGPLGPFIRTDMTKQTTVPGVFAGGDATRPAGNVAMAVADGAMAGLGRTTRWCSSDRRACSGTAAPEPALVVGRIAQQDGVGALAGHPGHLHVARSRSEQVRTDLLQLDPPPLVELGNEPLVEVDQIQPVAVGQGVAADDFVGQLGAGGNASTGGAHGLALGGDIDLALRAALDSGRKRRGQQQGGRDKRIEAAHDFSW